MRTQWLGLAAALAWSLLCLRWFDAAGPVRPAWLAAVPSWILWLATLALAGAWAAGKRRRLPKGPPGSRTLWLVVGTTAALRLPLLWFGGAGYVTADGALSGIVALRLARGAEHYVFVPAVAYSGSLKSHVAALLMGTLDPARAFAAASLLFYVLFVAALVRLGLLFREHARWTALGAGLYAAFAPAFVTKYSLSNDGNYVEVLALGTWALWLAVRWAREAGHGRELAAPMGLLLGLAFWSHILAVLYAAGAGLALLAHAPRRAARDAPLVAGGAALGYLPGLLWNATHGWLSATHLVPGERPGEAGGVWSRLAGLVADHAPILFGYDPGHPGWLDAAMRAVAAAAAVVGLAALANAVLRWARSDLAVRVLAAFAMVALAVAAFALPYLPGNPRYLLFLMTPLPLFVARLLHGRAGRWCLAALVAFGGASALGQAPHVLRADARWRAFVSDLERAGVRWCYSDFFVAARLNFLSGERLTCTAKLGPTTTEYFLEYRARVEEAPAAALIPVNASAAAKLGRRLERLGVGYERRELLKPVLIPVRKVDPAELFPGRSFPLR